MIKKICPSCGEERDIEQDFSWKHKERGTRNTCCKYCQSQASKKHYENNKQAYEDRARTHDSVIIMENRKKLLEFLLQNGCVDCGQTDIRVLDFAHVRGRKSNHISRMMATGCSWSTIKNEIAKCEVRCANCHRIRESKKSGSWRHLLSFQLVKEI